MTLEVKGANSQRQFEEEQRRAEIVAQKLIDEVGSMEGQQQSSGGKKKKKNKKKKKKKKKPHSDTDSHVTVDRADANITQAEVDTDEDDEAVSTVSADDMPIRHAKSLMKQTSMISRQHGTRDEGRCGRRKKVKTRVKRICPAAPR